RFNRYKSSHHHFYDLDYHEYFAEIHEGTIGFLIYDARHTYDLQLEALQLAEPFFSSNCIILIDDTNDNELRRAAYDFIASSQHQYQVLLDCTTYCNRHPTYWNGIIVFQKTTE
ncbi:MAG: hypothetical protein JSW54_09375, partial [Fidelibacterota bacterium]